MSDFHETISFRARSTATWLEHVFMLSLTVFPILVACNMDTVMGSFSRQLRHACTMPVSWFATPSANQDPICSTSALSDATQASATVSGNDFKCLTFSVTDSDKRGFLLTLSPVCMGLIVIV